MKVFIILAAFVAIFAVTYAVPTGGSGGEGIFFPVVPGGICKKLGDQGQNLLQPAQTCTCINGTVLLFIPSPVWGNCTTTPTTTTTVAPPTTSSTTTQAPSTSSTTTTSTTTTNDPPTTSEVPTTSDVPSTTSTDAPSSSTSAP